MQQAACSADAARGAQRRQMLAMAGAVALLGPLRSAATAGATSGAAPGAVPGPASGSVSGSAQPAATGWVVPPRPAPSMLLTGTDARKSTLSEALMGKVSAVQLMFTGCSATCPVQGALFAALAGSLRTTEVQLLSISIDVLGDTPARLREWQGRFGAHPAWHAAVADAHQVDALAAFMKGASAKPGTHTAQVFLFDPAAQLCLRTGDSPALGEVQAALVHVMRAG